MEKLERINKYLSEAGVCSRREVDDLIKTGRVEVNGAPAQIGMQIDTERDVVNVDGQRVDLAHPERNAISLQAEEDWRNRQNPWWKVHNEAKRQREEALKQNPKSRLLRKKKKTGTAGEQRVLRTSQAEGINDADTLRKAVREENRRAKSFAETFKDDKQGLMNVKTRRTEGVNPKAAALRGQKSHTPLHKNFTRKKRGV